MVEQTLESKTPKTPIPQSPKPPKTPKTPISKTPKTPKATETSVELDAELTKLVENISKNIGNSETFDSTAIKSYLEMIVQKLGTSFKLKEQAWFKEILVCAIGHAYQNQEHQPLQMLLGSPANCSLDDIESI